jgi:hypothetical protein
VIGAGQGPLDGGRLILLAVETYLGRVAEKSEKRLNATGSSMIAGMTAAFAFPVQDHQLTDSSRLAGSTIRYD